MERTLVIGFDAGDLSIIKENLESFPNFKRMLESSSYSVMRSVIPPVTIPAWISIYSGLSPDQLEIFDFQKVGFEDYEFHPRNNKGRGEFWNYLDSEMYLNSLPNNPRAVDRGYIIKTFLSYEEADGYPEEFDKEIRERNFGQIHKMEDFTSEKKRRDKAVENLESIFNADKWVLDEKEPEFTFTVYRILDTFLHHTQRWSEIRRAYKKADIVLGYFLDNFEGNVFIVSDHGCAEAKKRFYINTWLKKKGYFKAKKEEGKSRGFVLKLTDILTKLGLRDLLAKADSLYSKWFGENYRPNKNKTMKNMDSERTKAFSYMTGVCSFAGIWINDERFSSPAVQDKDKDKVAEEIISELEKEEEVEWVKRKEEVYENNVEHFPDLIVRFREDVKAAFGLHPEVVTTVSNFMHRYEGIFMAKGPDIKENYEIEEGIDIIDFFPTLLHMYGEEIPDDRRGRVVKEIFKEGSEPAEREVKYKKAEKKEMKDILNG